MIIPFALIYVLFLKELTMKGRDVREDCGCHR